MHSNNRIATQPTLENSQIWHNIKISLNNNADKYINSYRNLYSATSRELLKGALNYNIAKTKSLGKKWIQEIGQHRESMVLPSGGTGKMDKETA